MKRLGMVYLAAIATVASSPAFAVGIFAPAAGQAGSQAIAADDPTIAGWASEFSNYQVGAEVDAGFQTPARALGAAGDSDGDGETSFTSDIVSLGRGGQITLMFDTPLTDGPGFDFAVFENSFSDGFLELARVEVSSNGVDFFAFDAFSLSPGPVGGFGSVDPTNIEQVAGKYRGGFGTPFDLEQLAGTPGLDVSRVGFVRLVDIIGDGSSPNDLDPARLAAWLGIPPEDLAPALVDIAANAPAAIYDPFPTVGSAGFDLDAVAAINLLPIPVPGAAWFFASALGALLGMRRPRLSKP